MKRISVALSQALGAGVVLSLAATGVEAQQAQKVDKIEVTGSNIKRIEGESALPVTVITRDDIQKSGVTTTADLIDRLSANNAGGYSMAQAVGDSGTPGLSAASLRGLGSTNTLILLNGRRLSNFAFNGSGGGTVNLNQIPLAAVERVEVLKDGASAIYGTDAIGGVINFILRKDFVGIEASAYGTQTEGGGGNTRKYSATLGYGDINKNRFNVLVALDYQKDTALAAADRKFGSTGIRPDLGFSKTSGNAWPTNFLFNGTLYNVTAATGCVPQFYSYQINTTTGAPQPNKLSCRQDYTAALQIYPPTERKTAFGRAAFQINADNQAFIEYHKTKTDVEFASSFTPVADFTGAGPFLYPAGGRYYPTSFVTPAAAGGATIRPTGDLVISGWRLVSGGNRSDRSEADESRLVAGLQGYVFGWDYNVAVNASKSKADDIYIDGWVRTSVLKPAIATGNIDVFSGKPLDAAGQALVDSAKILQKVRSSESKVTSEDGKISKELTQLRAGPLALALGVEHRKEELVETYDPVQSGGDIQGGGGNPQPVSANRNVNAFFGELNVPIVKNLEAQFAVRYDKYSDFGSTTNPKVGIRWTPAKELLIRSSYSTGFRAPTLVDLFLPRSNSNTANNWNDPIRCKNGTAIGGYVNPGLECDAQFQNQVGGNAGLTPEKSRQWTLGVIWEPTNQLSVGTDFWSIRRRNSIGAIGDASIFEGYAVADPLNAGGFFVRYPRLANGTCSNDLPGSPATPANVPCAINYVVQVQQNLGKYNVTGLDFSGSFRFPAQDWGQVTIRGEGTYILEYKYQEQKDGDYADNAGLFTSTNGAITRWRHYATLNWRRGAWGATLGQTFVLGYTDDPSGGAPRKVGSYELYDLQGTWDGWKGLSFVAGIRNILDRDPPSSVQGQTFQVGYDPRYTDPHGRTYYLNLKYAFK